jgi:hypothetical protein
MASVIQLNKSLDEQIIDVEAKIAKKNAKKQIEDSLSLKTFDELTNAEKDNLLKLVAIKLKLIEE